MSFGNIYGGLLIKISYLFIKLNLNTSFFIKFILTLFNLAFLLATFKAFLLISIEVISKVLSSFFNIILIHPLPVPTSSTEDLFKFNFFIYLMVFSTKYSVSNLGIKVCLLTLILHPQKFTFPIKY